MILVVAIEVGMVLACLLFMKRMSDETGVRNWSHIDEISDEVRDAERARMRNIPSSISVCEITGPLFFGAADPDWSNFSNRKDKMSDS